MPTLELTTEQVIELVKQLPLDRKREVLLALAKEANGRRDELQHYAEQVVNQLPLEQQDALARQLILRQWTAWAELSRYGQEQARLVAAERGRDWDRMTEEEKEEFVDEVLHEE